MTTTAVKRGSVPRLARKKSSFTRQTLLLPAVIALLVFFFFPLVSIIWISFSSPTVGLGNYTALLHDNVTVKVLIRTFVIALVVMLAALIIAYPYAYMMTKASPRARRYMVLIVLVPFWTSLMARTFAWYVLEQGGGVIERFFALFGLQVVLLGTISGVAIAMVQVMLPFMILPLYSGMAGIDRRLLDAASSLGASRIKAFRDIYLPLSLPAVISGASLVFIITLGFYVTPALLGSPGEAMLSQVIAIRVNQLLDFAGAGALGLVLFVLTIVVVYVLSRLGQISSASGVKREVVNHE